MPGVPDISGQLFDTIGLEIEGTQKNRDDMMGTVMPSLQNRMGSLFSKVELDRDASTESIAETMRVGSKFLTINAHTSAYHRLSRKGSGDSRVYGYEFKTKPLEIFELEKVLYPLMWTLYEHGDVVSNRSSIHIHTGFANNFRMLKSLLQIMLTLEPVLYRLGGMGGTFRGHLNNAAYCRPLLNSCAVPVLRSGYGGRVYAQILNPIGARDSSSISEFWAHMGIEYGAGSQNKYHASRYSGFNLFALYSHHTVEWRYFNKSFDVPLVVAVAKLMRAVVETSSLVNSRDLSPFEVIDSNQEISTGDAESVLSMTVALCHDKGVHSIPTDNEVAHILHVLRESHFLPLPATPTACHIKDFAIRDELAKRGNLRILEEVLPTTYVDVHNLEGKTVSIFS